jgi:hypothetical protein
MSKYCLLFLFIAASVYSQTKKEYSFTGEYNQKSAQGMAIYKNSAFLLNHEGHCRIYDLKKKRLIAEFDLASVGKTNHANCASFGTAFPEGNKKYPALYVSECAGAYRCFVESINEKGAKLIQTLKLKTNGVEQYSCDWIIDTKQKCIYTITGASGEIDSIGTKKYRITQLPLPPLDSATVVFTEKDIIDRFEIAFPNLLQGGTVRKNRLYLPVGVHDYPGSEKRKDRERAMIIVNLKTKQIEKTINIANDVPHEPEDVDFHKGNLLLYCGQEGGLYRISEKK